MQQIHFHGHSILSGTREEYLRVLEQKLMGDTCTQIVTINPEYIVLAEHNPLLKSITQPPALAIPDGIGLVWALRKRGAIAQRYSGADMIIDICAFAQKSNIPVGVLTAAQSLSTPEEIQTTLQKRFPQLRVCTASETTPNVLSYLKAQNITILFVTFGQPRQDIWIAQKQKEIPSVRLAVGVGGACDFLTGKRKRAPRILQHFGLEWMWRLSTQPRRLPRMLRATFGFWHVILTTP